MFVRDLQTNATILVSRQSGPEGAAGDDGSFGASLSADGRLVAFESNADNLSGEDTDGGVTDIFVRDMQSNSLTFLSRQSGAGGAGGDKDSFTPAISADGRFAAFWSYADNLSSEDSDGIYDVFRRELPVPVTQVSPPTAARV